MNIIKCIECGCEDYLIIDTQGDIREGWIVEDVECLECGEVFAIKANFTDIKVEEGVY